MSLDLVHYDVAPDLTFIDYDSGGRELYLDVAVICLDDLPTATPAPDNVMHGINHYPANTMGAIRTIGELSVWQGNEPLQASAETELTRLWLAVLFSNRWIQAARSYREAKLGSIPADTLNGGAINPDFDHEYVIRLEANRWRRRYEFLGPLLNIELNPW